MLTLHHLETSRSSRIIWLLEALGVKYELVTHKRVNGRSPPELAAVHPLAKGPTLVDGDFVLVESTAILRYISDNYGDGRFQPPPRTKARAKHDEWLDYAEGSLMGPVIVKLIGSMGGGGMPATLEQYAKFSLDKALDYIGNGVGKGPFLMGAELTMADMQMSYCLALLEAGGSLTDRPVLQAYWQRLQDEPGYKRTLEIGGPLVSFRS